MLDNYNDKMGVAVAKAPIHEYVKNSMPGKIKSVVKIKSPLKKYWKKIKGRKNNKATHLKNLKGKRV